MLLLSGRPVLEVAFFGSGGVVPFGPDAGRVDGLRDVVAGLAGTAALEDSRLTDLAFRIAGLDSALSPASFGLCIVVDAGPPPDSRGTSTTPEHAGQRIFFPATVSGTFSVFWQLGHRTSIDISLVAVKRAGGTPLDYSEYGAFSTATSHDLAIAKDSKRPL